MGNRILVMGATGATGRAVVTELLERGHHVTAFSRSATSFSIEHPRFDTFVGDATDRDDVLRAVAGHDAVTVLLGIAENPLLVRLRGPSRTPINIRSLGTQNVIDAMREHGVRRLIVQTTYGLGEDWAKLSLTWKLMFWALLKPQIADTELQAGFVRDSGLDWVLVEPVALTDDQPRPEVFESQRGEVRSMSIPRRNVARFISETVGDPARVQRTYALSA